MTRQILDSLLPFEISDSTAAAGSSVAYGLGTGNVVYEGLVANGCGYEGLASLLDTKNIRVSLCLDSLN